MLALFVALLASVLLAPASVTAQQTAYTVWSSAIFLRTGERTPEVLGLIPTTLTSAGAQQAYAQGQFFRERYASSVGSSDGVGSGPIQGLSANQIDPLQLYVIALDEQYTVATAQAFVQGLYPPYSLNGSTAQLLDPTSVLSNGVYVDAPLSGYQYSQIHVSGPLDPDFIYIAGNLDCPAFDDAAVDYTSTPQFAATEAESKVVYSAVGPSLLSDVLNADAWDYDSAYAIYDYLVYQNAHNATVNALLSSPNMFDRTTNTSFLDRMQWYADQQQYAQLGNLSAPNDMTSAAYPTSGSISTIAGNLLAAKLLAQLQVMVSTNGEFFKLSVTVGDYSPMMSFFALAGLPTLNSNFYGLPSYSSAMIFELFSYTNSSTNSSTNLPFPSVDELWVRFYFRNGTDASDNYQAYPMFNRGPSETDMTWNDFQNAMDGVLMSDVGDWCAQCGAINLFCGAWNNSDTFSSGGSNSAGSSSSTVDNHSVSPNVAGVIGAFVTLAIAALIFAAMMVIGGVRFHRVQRSHKSDLGGFKGGQKLASDRDLTLAKGGATVERQASVSDGAPKTGHERVGSWELEQAQTARSKPSLDRPSFEDDERVNPFREPVKADERV